MDSIGFPQLSWVRGYSGGHAKYIDRSTLVYACGNNVNFVKEGGQSQVFTSPGEGVSCLDVHQLNKHFAFAELSVKPRIFVFNYPAMEAVSELSGAAELEHIALTFSSSDYLVSISGIPQYQMTLWNYMKGESLLTVDLIHRPITSLSVNPGNWRQISMSTEETFTVFTVEQSDIRYTSGAQNVKLYVGESDNASRIEESPSRGADVQTITRLEVDLTPSAIAGLLDPEAEQFEDLQDSRLKCVPVSHNWTPKGDLLVGCQGGQLLRIDGESWQVVPLYIPLIKDRRKSKGYSLGRGTLLSREMSIMEEDDTTINPDESYNMIGPGSVNCMILHKNGLYLGGVDGTIRCIDVTNDKLRLVDSYPVGVPITCLNFSTTWNHLNIGSSVGCIYTYDVTNPGSVTKFIEENNTNFVGIGNVAPEMDCSVTVRENGCLQVWGLQDGRCYGSLAMGIGAVCMTTSIVAPVAVIGSKSGFVFMVDMSDVTNLRIVHRVRVYNSPVTHVEYTSDGRYILTGADDGNIIIMSGRAHETFKMLTFTNIEGVVETITTFTEKEGDVKVVVSSNATGHAGHGANKCNTFELKDSVLSNVEHYYNSLKADIQDEAINKIVFNYASSSYGACLIANNVLYSLAQDNKKIQKLNIPKEKPKKPNSKDSFLLPEEEMESHQLPGGKLVMSPHQKWVASGGMDGKLQVRTIGTLDRYVDAHPHDYRHGGVKSVQWSLGSQHILTAGRSDGVLCCYTWRGRGDARSSSESSSSSRRSTRSSGRSVYTPSGETKGKTAVSALKQVQGRLAEVIMRERDALKAMAEWNPDPSKFSFEPSHSTLSNIERAINNDDIYQTPTPVPKDDSTWIEVRQLLAHTEEDKEYKEKKTELRHEIRDIRRTLQDLMEANKKLAEIEQLQHHDFDLDVDEQQRLQTIGEAEVQRIREEIEFENLAKQYLTHLIKQECWDSMEVKGRSIEGFSVLLEVQNYAMHKRSKEEVEELSRAVATRRIEIAEAKIRSELVEIVVPKPSQTQFDDDDFDFDFTRPRVTNEETADDDDVEMESPSITGSMGSMYGGKSDLFYNQFELFSREQKVNQIILLKDAIYRIKQTFNKEFDDVLTKKDQELAKINEKNKRITKIYQDLGIMDSVKSHAVSSKEKPELLLTVADNEVTVEKYLTPEQQKAKEEFEKAEEERRKREQGDNARERALDQMMGGVLEIKKEDELKKDVPIPPFMQTKQRDDWSEDEHKIAKEYERKVKELTEEREKYAKQLEAELKKLQQIIGEAEQSFNDVLRQLFTKKLKVEMVISQEELKIVRLQYGLMVQAALETKEKQLIDTIDHKKSLKLLSAEAFIQARKNVDHFKEGYDILVAEDKVMDKGFKREFADCTALQVDQLYKLFRKRPRGQRALHNRGETPILDPSSGNPFAERPSTARQQQMQKQAIAAALADLDKESNVPEGLEPSVWERLCKYRSHKIESEQLVKQKALIMAEMMAFQQKRQDEDYKTAEEIEDLSQELNVLREAMQRNNLNLQVQLLMKQGQVELDAGPFIHNYQDSVLVHRNVVEDLNGSIKALGESKIASMVESKDFRKGIIQLEWEHKKNMMKIEDLKNRMRDINMMKVTREIQSYLNEEDHDAKISQEVGILEQTILLQKKHHDANVENKKKILAELRLSVKDKELENRILLKEIEGLNVSVNERQHIQEASADKNEESNREKRYIEIVQRRKLVDLAKAQANEVAVLRAEVERLRMRTFPALVQVER